MGKMVDQFIEELRNEKQMPNTYNQYLLSSIAVNNLKLYLEKMQLLKPKIMLIGEAPGYKGCKLTGIPFSSEKLILSNSRSGILGENHNYLVRDKYNLQTESTATIIWRTFEELNFFPILWNAFPFHPHKDNTFNTNRTPNSEELLVGKKYINYLTKMYKIEKIYAIGNSAYTTLVNMGIETEKIRHPSFGGKSEFINGINRVVASI